MSSSKQGLFIQSSSAAQTNNTAWWGAILQTAVTAITVFPAYLGLIYLRNELDYAKADTKNLKIEMQCKTDALDRLLLSHTHNHPDTLPSQ